MRIASLLAVASMNRCEKSESSCRGKALRCKIAGSRSGKLDAPESRSEESGKKKNKERSE
jgi:hypothetical protein